MIATSRTSFVALTLSLCLQTVGIASRLDNAAETANNGSSDRRVQERRQREDQTMVKKPGSTSPAAIDATTPEPKLITFPGPRGMLLHGYVYVPAGNGPFPAIIWNHGSEERPGWQPDLARFYTSNGFVFFIPHRHGQGKSADAGLNHVEQQKQCESTADPRKCAVHLHELYNKNVLAAVAWIEQQPYAKRDQIVMSGVSFGGIQTLLTAEKGAGVRAFVPFAPAAMSWRNEELQARLLQTVKRAQAPILLIQAEGDYSTGPYEMLGRYLKTKGGKNGAKLYPKFGSTNAEAHAVFATKPEGIKIWGPDVLSFLERATR